MLPRRCLFSSTRWIGKCHWAGNSNTPGVVEQASPPCHKGGEEAFGSFDVGATNDSNDDVVADVGRGDPVDRDP